MSTCEYDSSGRSHIAANAPRIEQIRASVETEYQGGEGEGLATAVDDVRFLLEQYDAAVKILAAAERVAPGLITTAGRFAL